MKWTLSIHNAAYMGSWSTGWINCCTVFAKLNPYRKHPCNALNVDRETILSEKTPQQVNMSRHALQMLRDRELCAGMFGGVAWHSRSAVSVRSLNGNKLQLYTATNSTNSIHTKIWNDTELVNVQWRDLAWGHSAVPCGQLLWATSDRDWFVHFWWPVLPEES